MRDALGHQTTVASYDLFGNVKSVVDSNDVETQYQYDGRDRITEVRVRGVPDHPNRSERADVVTQYRYEPGGNLDFVRLPNCVAEGAACEYTYDFTYDSVDRLTEVRDARGNRVIITYDTAGNRVREEAWGPTDYMAQWYRNFAYDDFGRVKYVYFNDIHPNPDGVGDDDPGSIFWKYEYYDDGSLRTARDPEGHGTTLEYDALKRLTTITQTVDQVPVVTRYEYDVQDNLKAVTDPNLLRTSYTNSDMGWRRSTSSPDTGLTTYVHDAAGNATSLMDANGITPTGEYDALNRLRAIRYPDPTLDVTYTYDLPTETFFNVGRRTGMTDPSGSSLFDYDRQGHLGRERKTIGGRTYTTEYDFDATGNLTEILYPRESLSPSRGAVTYQYDAANRVSLVTAQVNDATRTVASLFSYKPFGPRTSLRFGNALVDSRTYSSRYQLRTWSVGAGMVFKLNDRHEFDDDLNLTRITNNIAPPHQSFAYDEIHRLKSASGWWGPSECAGPVTYTYDSNGNRLCKGEGGPATSYAYFPGTNRLQSVTTDSVTTSFSYDANGNITGDGIHAYVYNQADRLATVDPGPNPRATYLYDGGGRRVVKTALGETTYFLYDPDGRLLTEVDPASGTGKDYLYLEGVPIGRLDWNVTEVPLAGDPLTADIVGSSVRLDWSGHAASGPYVVRRKQVVDSADRTFDGSTVLAMLDSGITTYDDPVAADSKRYDYEVFEKIATELLYYYHTDHLGTPKLMTNGNGVPVWKAEYRPFGDVFSFPVTTVENNLRFPGQYYDWETGLHQNWFRDYDPSLGRYREPDPIGIAGDLSLYSYVADDPINVADPLGLYGWYEFLEDSANVSAGFGDTLTLGGTYEIRKWIGGNESVDLCSREYGAGEVAATVHSLALGGASVARGALAMGGSSGTLPMKFMRGAGRFYTDTRQFSTVSRQYWAARGGAGASNLHHWLIPQRIATMNAGWNLMEIPMAANSWMGYSSVGRTAEWLLRAAIPASIVAGGTAGAKWGLDRQFARSGCGCRE